MNTEIRKAENYKIINSIHIGDKEIVLGIDMQNPDGNFYMVADYERNELFEKYSNALVSSNYIEIAEIYSDRLKDQIEKVKTAEKDMPKGIIAADMCDSITDKDLEGKIIVIEANTLRPEYRTEAHQIVRCTGGNGARPDARGSAVFCEYLYKDKNTRFERYDVLGILKKEHYPEWLTKRLEFEKEVKGNTVFEYGGYHFLPVGIVDVANPLKYISNHTISDKSLGIWSNKYNNHYGKNKIDYTHKGFYNACNKIACDIFKCLENNKVYIPATNELFEYTGEYKAYEEKATKTKSKKHKDMER